MLKQVSMAALSVVVLSACACSTLPLSEIDGASGVAPVSESYGKSGKANKAYVSARDVEEANKMLVAQVGDRVFFPFDSASLTPDARKQLQNIATFIKQNEKSINTVVVEGHCDERGTREYNLALGDRRAVAAKKYLVGLGIDADMITTISYGKERPAVEGHDEESWAKNRRGVVVFQ